VGDSGRGRQTLPLRKLINGYEEGSVKETLRQRTEKFIRTLTQSLLINGFAVDSEKDLKK
jgi:hypothetical protein